MNEWQQIGYDLVIVMKREELEIENVKDDFYVLGLFNWLYGSIIYLNKKCRRNRYCGQFENDDELNC